MSEVKILVRRSDGDSASRLPTLPALETVSAEDRETLAVILCQQAENENMLKRQIVEFGRMLVVMEGQNRQLQKLIESRVTVTTAQARALAKQVAARAMELCEGNHLDYAAYGRRFRAAITKELKHSFVVTAIGDLPAVALNLATVFVAEWSSYQLARELRMKDSSATSHV